MKKLILSIVILICSAAICRAQFIFDLKDKNLDYAKGYEKVVKGKIVVLNTQYPEDEVIGDPVVYQRPETTLPNLLIYYFPNKTDGKINYILYEWDEANFTKDAQAEKQPLEWLQQYVNKYRTLLSLVKTAFGNGESTGSLDDMAQIAAGKFKRKDTFSKDGIEVEMYIVLSNKQETNGMVSIMPTHRIRMYVRHDAGK